MKQKTKHKTARLPAWIAIILITAAVLVACSQETENPIVVTDVTTVEGEEVVVTRVVRQTIEIQVTQPADDTAEPVSLEISTNGDYDTLDPQVTIEENAVDVIENIFVGLTRYNHATDTVEPALATSWETSAGGRRWIFQLRDDIYWIRRNEADSRLLGNNEQTFEPVRPVTAEDVVYAIRRACDPQVTTPDVFILFIIEGCERVHNLTEVTSDDLEEIGVEALGDDNLQFTLTTPASYFLTMTTLWPLRPVPSEIVEEMGTEWVSIQNIWTSGPYVLSQETVAGTRTVLNRNPYWPIPSQGNIDTVSILHLDDDNDAYRLWEERQLDRSPVPLTEQTNILRQHGLKADLVSEQAVFYLSFDFESPVFSVPEIRQAFSYAIDRERLIREVHGDRALPMRHFGPPGVIGGPPIDQVGMGYNPDRARQLMDGTFYGDCRLLPPITYLVSSSDIALQQAELLREMWMEELACNEEQIIIEQVQFGTLLASTRPDAGGLRPDIWDLGWASYYPDENNWLGDVLHCTRSENRQLRPCSEVDELIDQASETTDIDERWDLYRRAEGAFFGENGIEPIANLYVRANYVLRHPWLSYTPAHFGGEQYDTFIIDAAVKDLERIR